jgi:putative restriction endonuclease
MNAEPNLKSKHLEKKRATSTAQTVIIELTFLILNDHFPETMHEDILNDVGINLDFRIIKSRTGDPKFRENILIAYEYRCAVCNFQVHLGQKLVGVEAAHI